MTGLCYTLGSYGLCVLLALVHKCVAGICRCGACVNIMADEDWKKRVGVSINYNSDTDEERRNQAQNGSSNDNSPESEGNSSPFHLNSNESSIDAILHKYEQYGNTPPRTRLSRHMRDWKRREKEQERKEGVSQSKITRRNTFDVMYLNDFPEVTESDGEQPKNDPDKRVCKRHMKLLRGSERDLKLDLNADTHSFSVDCVDRAESVPLDTQPAMKVESSNRFLSLTSKLVACQGIIKSKANACFSARQELYSLLLPFGLEKLPDKMAYRQLSHEEYRWQNELKDLIWLELQAWHASRSLPDQDHYLCKAREDVEYLLRDIMDYKFEIDTKRLEHLETPLCTCDRRTVCLSMFCHSCYENQNAAIKDIENLTKRLEHAESLFPSSKNFASTYPLYKDERFIGRVKAMCLWLNITKVHRLKILILGRLFISHSLVLCKEWNWYVHSDADSGHGSSEPMMDQDSPPAEEVPSRNIDWKPSVRFDKEYIGSSPSDSAGSNNSSNIFDMPDDCVSKLSDISQQICPIQKQDRSMYRNFIDEMLKTKGLRKSLRFLEKLHRHTLIKSCISLEKSNVDCVDLECPHADELTRHGFWSQEMQEIGLPSYHASFLFLARIPVRLIQECLDMRLEQQPEKPSDLCLRQLMIELKEGLRLGVLYRQRYETFMKRAFDGVKVQEDLYETLSDLDMSSQKVFHMYLDYLQRWFVVVEEECYQKNILDEEWVFAKEVGPHIPDGNKVAGSRFCRISRMMLHNLGVTLDSRTESLTKSMQSSTVTKQSILSLCRELQCLLNDMRDRFLKAFSFTKCLIKDAELLLSTAPVTCLELLKNEALELCKTIKVTMMNVENTFNMTDSLDVDAKDNEAVQATIRETLHQGYKFGFEFHKEACRTFKGNVKAAIAKGLNHFAGMWMNFVKQRCERGRGVRPRWANQGLDYLLFVCQVENTKHLSDEEFRQLKLKVEDCVQYIIGKNPDVSPEVRVADSFCASRGNSPTPRALFRRSPHDGSGRLQTPSRKSSIHTPSDGSLDSPSPQERKNVLLYVSHSRMEGIRSAVSQLDQNMDNKLKNQHLIGRVTAIHTEDRVHIRLKQVNFSWQRGIKIGQGSFGKVYTAVNNQTGELMAMKEMVLQPNDHRTIKKIAQELRIFEGIQHKHLVRYYGVEIHRDEMLIFMEFCEEGTLETLVAATNNGLSEPLVRRYTLQLMKAVHTLHVHGIVHRDIKSANIFLTDEGNSLKLGDFGSAVKIKAHTTMPGELQGFVGTQAYMAPEVFTKMHSEGHGRAADIWSVGCVVVEMASGKRPWAELDSNYQVMFKVGMGATPSIPTSLSEEGFDFVDHCLQHDPQQRSTASELLNHGFVREDCEGHLSLLASADDYET